MLLKKKNFGIIFYIYKSRLVVYESVAIKFLNLNN